MDQNDVVGKIWDLFEAGQFIPACAWCGRVRIEGDWHNTTYGTLSAIGEPMALSHSICPDCAAAQEAPADEQRSA